MKRIRSRKEKHFLEYIRKKMIPLLLTALMVISAIPFSGSAKTFYRTAKEVSNSGMQPTASELRGLSGDDIWKGSSFSKQQYIYSSYAFNAIEFKETGIKSHQQGAYGQTGWYCFRTEGSCDTVGELWRTYLNTSGWPWNWHYESQQIMRNDDSTVSGDGRNFRMVYRMDENESVYLTTRLYSYNSGNYKVIIEPNNDPKTSTTGGYWEVNKDGYYNAAGYYSTDYTLAKLYLTKEQVATMYEIFRDSIADSTIARTRLKKMFASEGYSATVEALFSAVGDALLSFAPAAVQALGKCVGYISDILTPVFEDALGIFLEDPEECAKICIQLEDVAGAKKQYGKYKADHGILITKRKQNFGSSYVENLYYTEYDSTNLYGADYEKGTWRYFNETASYLSYYYG